MSFLLDTNICSVAIKDPGRLFSRFHQYAGNLCDSRISLAELYAWERCQHNPAEILQPLLNDVRIVEFDDACALEFGRLRRDQASRGLVTPSIDLLIAATAVANNLTLVTHNLADFANVADLRTIDWLTS